MNKERVREIRKRFDLLPGPFWMPNGEVGVGDVSGRADIEFLLTALSQSQAELEQREKALEELTPSDVMLRVYDGGKAGRMVEFRGYEATLESMPEFSKWLQTKEPKKEGV